MTVVLPGPSVGGRGAAAAQHGGGLPAGDAHEVGLVAALGAPGVGEGVAEQVRVEAVDAGLPAAAGEDLADARVGDAALLADPQPLKVRVRVAGTSSEVAIERQDRLPAERECALSVALAGHPGYVVVEVDVLDPHAGDLGKTRAGIEQDHDDRGVPPRLEGLAGADGEQPLERVVRQDGYRLFGD